ncbi:hypothetical protein KI387_009382, partial [Taxus chinensis]
DNPPSFPQYRRDDMERPLPLPQPTVPTGEEEEPVDRYIDDAGCTKRYKQWWAAQLRAIPPRSGKPDLATITVQRDILQ